MRTASGRQSAGSSADKWSRPKASSTFTIAFPKSLFICASMIKSSMYPTDGSLYDYRLHFGPLPQCIGHDTAFVLHVSMGAGRPRKSGDESRTPMIVAMPGSRGNGITGRYRFMREKIQVSRG